MVWCVCVCYLLLLLIFSVFWNSHRKAETQMYIRRRNEHSRTFRNCVFCLFVCEWIESGKHDTCMLYYIKQQQAWNFGILIMKLIKNQNAPLRKKTWYAMWSCQSVNIIMNNMYVCLFGKCMDAHVQKNVNGHWSILTAKPMQYISTIVLLKSVGENYCCQKWFPYLFNYLILFSFNFRRTYIILLSIWSEMV